MKLRSMASLEELEGPAVALLNISDSPEGIKRRIPSGTVIIEPQNSSDLQKCIGKYSCLIVGEEFIPILDQLWGKSKNTTNERIVITSDEPGIGLFRAVADISDDWVVTGFETSAECALIEIKNSTETDRALDDLMYGFFLARSSQDEKKQSDKGSVDENILTQLRKYHMLLEYLVESGVPSSPTVKDSLVPREKNSPDDVESTASSAKITELTAEIMRLEAENTSLKRRYKALAESRLGSLTLKYWERKRKSQ